MMRLASALAAVTLFATGCSAASTAEQGAQREVAAEPKLLTPVFPDLPRQRIVLMSSLPLVYGAGIDMAGVIAGKADPHPLHSAMADSHDLVVPDVISAQALANVRLMILVQPRALAPEELVAIDDFVRGGGRLMLFADPQLEWPRGQGLGDPRGPLRSSLVSPLLKHWRLEMTDPGIESAPAGDMGAKFAHPGQFWELQGKSGDATCRIAAGGHVARCTIGRGRALLIADADVLEPAAINDSGESGRAHRLWVHNLIAELAGDDST